MEQRVRKPSLLGLCRVATEEGEANEEKTRSGLVTRVCAKILPYHPLAEPGDFVQHGAENGDGSK